MFYFIMLQFFGGAVGHLTVLSFNCFDLMNIGMTQGYSWTWITNL